MDFEYDAYGGLEDFCSTEFDEEIKKEAAKLTDDTENLNECDIVLQNVPKKDVRFKSRISLSATGNNIINNVVKNRLSINKVKNLNYNVILKKKHGRQTKKKSKDNMDEISPPQKYDDFSNQSEKCSRQTRSKTPRNRISDASNISMNPQIGCTRGYYMSKLAANCLTATVIETFSNGSDRRRTSTGRNRCRKTRSNSKRSCALDVVVIGSDSDENNEYDEINFYHQNKNISIDDEENPDTQILIEWHNTIEKFQIRKYQPFHDVMEIFAKKERVMIKDILFNLQNSVISANDTIESINYKFGDIISGRVVENCQPNISNISSTKSKRDEICLKIQSNLWKKPIDVYVKRTESFKILYIRCVETLKLNIADFVLKFDGDNLKPDETANDMGMEGNEIIDCIIKKK